MSPEVVHAKYSFQFSHRCFHPVLMQELMFTTGKDFSGNMLMKSSKELHSFLTQNPEIPNTRRIITS